jgi:hypothetical protein
MLINTCLVNSLEWNLLSNPVMLNIKCTVISHSNLVILNIKRRFNLMFFDLLSNLVSGYA